MSDHWGKIEALTTLLFFKSDLTSAYEKCFLNSDLTSAYEKIAFTTKFLLVTIVSEKEVEVIPWIIR